jgi:hypothetical protein
MSERTKIDFHFRSVGRLRDFTELIELLFPGNRNQQYAAAAIVLELKWTQELVPDLGRLEDRYQISRRILQRTRAKLTRLGLIEHVSRWSRRYGGREGWILSTRMETGLGHLARKIGEYKRIHAMDREKELLLLSLLDARRNATKTRGR